MKRLARSLLATTLMFAATAPALAEGINAVPCGEKRDTIPFSDPTFWNSAKSYYNGRLRIFLYAEDEPVCCGDYIVVLLPSDPNVARDTDACHIVRKGRLGFGTLNGLRRLGSSYDPAVGLTLSFPYQTFDPATSSYFPAETGRILINMATRQVTAW